MKVYTREEFEQNKDLVKAILDGAVFVYPTDTIYGIGCDATNSLAVKRVRELKQTTQPFSVIAPSKKWITENCVVNSLDKLPGPYTLILSLKNKNLSEVNSGKDTLGVRMPDHWITEFVKSLGRPLVTTSANVHGQPFMTKIEDLRLEVDFVVYEGPKEAKPSTIIDLNGNEIKR